MDKNLQLITLINTGILLANTTVMMGMVSVYLRWIFSKDSRYDR